METAKELLLVYIVEDAGSLERVPPGNRPSREARVNDRI
jgi:hypothetical protein